MAGPRKKEIIGAVIVAAGSSRRMDGKDKILMLLAGKPVLLRALEPFLNHPKISRIVLVLNRRNLKPARALLEKDGLTNRVMTCLGGKRRQDSTLAGVKKLGVCDRVLVHDCARPLVTKDIIERGLEAAQLTGVATAAVPVTDTIKSVDAENYVRETLPRENLWQIQTPQVFLYTMLLEAFEYNDTDVTDDTQLAECAGVTVRLYMGAYDNIKITTPTDIVIAAALLKQRKA